MEQAKETKVEKSDSVPEAEADSKTEPDQTAYQKQQEQYRQAYLLQQQRRNCPGCGDGGEIF